MVKQLFVCQKAMNNNLMGSREHAKMLLLIYVHVVQATNKLCSTMRGYFKDTDSTIKATLETVAINELLGNYLIIVCLLLSTVYLEFFKYISDFTDQTYLVSMDLLQNRFIVLQIS